MIIVAMLLILLFIGMNIKYLIQVGFPDYISIDGLGIIDNLNHSQVLHPYGLMLVILILSKGLYSLASSYYIDRFIATEITYGTVISIQFSKNSINNKPLVNLEVRYFELTGMFKDQPGDFAFEFKKGDLIPVKHQKQKPEVAVIPTDAIEIMKSHPSNE
jgi:hypothetical protein